MPGEAAINYLKNDYAEQGLAETLIRNRKEDAKKATLLLAPTEQTFYFIIKELR